MRFLYIIIIHQQHHPKSLYNDRATNTNDNTLIYGLVVCGTPQVPCDSMARLSVCIWMRKYPSSPQYVPHCGCKSDTSESRRERQCSNKGQEEGMNKTTH